MLQKTNCSFNLIKYASYLLHVIITITYITSMHDIAKALFFNTWFTDFFKKILRSEEGKK